MSDYMEIFLILLNSNQKVPEVLAPLFYLYRCIKHLINN